MLENPFVRLALGFLNRFLMVPMFRLGLGPFIGNPFTGYIMVIKTVGRRTQQARYTPVNYAILNGQVYCMAGFGSISDWYRNLLANSAVELILPSGAVIGTAEVVTEHEERLVALRQVLKNSGFAGFAAGFNAFTMPEAVLREKLKDFPAIRIKVTGIGNGAGDANGWLWMLELIIVTVVIIWLVLR